MKTQVLEWTQQILRAGEAFSGAECTTLRDALQRHSGRFFDAFHAANLQVRGFVDLLITSLCWCFFLSSMYGSSDLEGDMQRGLINTFCERPILRTGSKLLFSVCCLELLLS